LFFLGQYEFFHGFWWFFLGQYYVTLCSWGIWLKRNTFL
jgi:hypothetical protein